jgi:excisionase family DNA binding protein
MKVNIITDDKLTVAELAEFADVCRHTVVRWMEKKGLPFVRVGKQRMTTVQVFEEWTRRDSQDD